MRVLVTGGGGFLGQAIIRRLVARGDVVRNLQRSDSGELIRLGVECIRGDIADSEAVRQAAVGCEIIYHVAAKAGVWGRYDEFYKANVVGTENILSACRTHGIGKLVYTSSPSVVFNGHDESGIDESVPYPTRYLSVIIPGRKRMQSGWFWRRTVQKFGDGRSAAPFDLGTRRQSSVSSACPESGRESYVESAMAVMLSTRPMSTMQPTRMYWPPPFLHQGSAVAGKAYFISNGEPVPLWGSDRPFTRRCGGVAPVTKSVSATTAYLAGSLLELIYTLAGCVGEPPMTRFVARQLSTSHWFRLEAARRDFGYVPAVTVDEGLKRLAQSIKTMNPENFTSKD